MSQDANTVASPFLSTWFSFGFYKRSQGRWTRYATFFSLVIIAVYGAYSCHNFLSDPSYSAGVSGAVLLAGLWFAFRIVQWPRFADFLIGVEAEVNKVSWPSKPELYRSVIVVMLMLFGLAAVIFVFDIVWRTVLGALGIVGPGGG